jgi:multidrug efflux system membrane fusion protein
MRRRRAWWLAAAAVAIVGLALAIRWEAARRAAQARALSAGEGGAGGAAQQARPVPVTVATVARRDVPVYLEGLGSVVASRMVTVRTQVDGRLQDVRFREGQHVRQGEVLAQIDPRPFQAALDQAEGALLRDQSQLRAAQLNVERDRRLAAQHLIAQQQLDTDQALSGQYQGSVRIDQAAIETARLNLDYARITSPVDGVTGILAVDPGNVVHATDTGGIVVVTQLDPVGVIFSLPQDDLVEISTQLARGPLPVTVRSRDAGAELGQGTLEVIDNQINASTSTLRLKAVVPNPHHLLWPNQFVNARLELETRAGALVMPVAAVQRGPSGTFAWVANADGTAAERPVELSLVQGDQALLAGGLRQGERVVVEGQNQLRPGARLAPREAGPGAPGSAAGEGGPVRAGTGGGPP